MKDAIGEEFSLDISGYNSIRKPQFFSTDKCLHDHKNKTYQYINKY
jgi:hypothetical protein